MNEPKVIITSYSVPVPDPKSKKPLINECDCGAHLWAFPWADDAAAWVAHQRSPLKHWIEERGLAPRFPDPKMHVVVASPVDRPLLELRRWRVFPTRPWCRAKWQLASGRRGLPLQRMILSSAKVVRFKDGNGLNVMRTNLQSMTLKQLAEEARAGKAAEKAKKAA
jgi:hypothetical protein